MKAVLERQRRRIEEEEEMEAVLKRQRKRIEEQRLKAEEEAKFEYVVRIQKFVRRYNARRLLSLLREQQVATEQAAEEERINDEVKARIASDYKIVVEKAAEEARAIELKRLAKVRDAATLDLEKLCLVGQEPAENEPAIPEDAAIACPSNEEINTGEEDDTFAVDTQTDWDVEGKAGSSEGIEVDANDFSEVAEENNGETNSACVAIEENEVEPGEIPMKRTEVADMSTTPRREVHGDRMEVEATDDSSVESCKNAICEEPVVEDHMSCSGTSASNPLLDPIFLDEFAPSQSPMTVPASQDSSHCVDELPERVETAPSDEIVEGDDAVELEPTKTTKDAIELIRNRDWLELEEMIESHPRLASTTLSHGSSMLSSGTQGNLLLHEVCKNDPPVDVVDSVVKAHNAALATRGQWGYLPLHYACASASSVAVIKLLISSYPDAVKEVDGNEKMLPLHLACKWGISQESITALLKAYPEATSVLDSYSKIPMDYAISLSPGPVRAATVDSLLEEGSSEEGHNVEGCLSGLREEFDSLVTDLQNVSEESPQDEVLIEKKTVAGLAHAQAEKKALLDADRKVVHELQAAQAEKTALLESEKTKNRDIETTVAEREALLETEKLNVKELESTVSRKQTLLETEQETVKALERAISQRDALLDLEQMKIKRLEIVQSEKRVLLESEHEMVQAIAQKHAEKVALLESEEAIVVDLECKKQATKALIESEETMMRELERRQAEKAALLEAEQQLVKALERTKAEKQALREAEQKTQEEIQNSKIERRRLSAAVQTFLNLSRSQKNLFLRMAQQKANFILRVTHGASRFFYEPFMFSRHKKLLREPKDNNNVIAATGRDTSGTEEQNQAKSGGTRVVSKFLVYCNGLIGLNKPRRPSKKIGDE